MLIPFLPILAHRRYVVSRVEQSNIDKYHFLPVLPIRWVVCWIEQREPYSFSSVLAHSWCVVSELSRSSPVDLISALSDSQLVRRHGAARTIVDLIPPQISPTGGALPPDLPMLISTTPFIAHSWCVCLLKWAATAMLILFPPPQEVCILLH